MNVNIIGNGLTNNRSINVSADLLGEWTTNQVHFRREATRCLAGICCCLATLSLAVPSIEGTRAATLVRQRKHEAELESLKVLLAEATAVKSVIEPKVATSKLMTATSGYFNRMLGELYVVLDSSKSGMAFASTKIEVRSAQILIDCRAEAESYEIAAAFAEQAGQTPNKVSTLASTRPSTLLGPYGISFEYMKRVPIE